MSHRGPALVRIPKGTLVNLLLWRKIAGARCFVWCLGLQMWSGSKAVRRNLEFLQFFKNSISEDVKCIIRLRWTSATL